MNSFSLYIHIPWCVRKCPYCDFNSQALNPTAPNIADERVPTLWERDYVAGLIHDWQAQWSAHPYLRQRQLTTIFFGGGTPSLFSPASIGQILEAIHRDCPINEHTEITLEANPATTGEGEEAIRTRLLGFRSAGINRLSVGVQSFSESALRHLGRVHSSEQAIKTLTHALTIFPRVNADLMFGLPNQTMSEMLADINTALSLSIQHLSCYQLTIEPQTLFYAKPPRLPDDDLIADMGEALVSRLAEEGLARYEISAFAKAGDECAHNLNYWRFGDYVGIGAGAHGKISVNLNDGLMVMRTERTKNPQTYMKQCSSGTLVLQTRQILPEERTMEFMMNALRLVRGFNSDEFSAHTGLPLPREKLNALVQDGWLAWVDEADEGTMIRPTALGINHANRLLHHFF